MSKRITGRAIITFDGGSVPMENGAKLNPGGESRKPERHGGKTYYSSEEMAPSVEGVVLHTADVDILKLSAMEGVTVMFTADTGQVYLLSGGVTAEPVDLDAGKGKCGLKVFADSCVRV